MMCHGTGTNRLEVFKRVPSDLRRYRFFLANIKASHGSVMGFIMRERVRWVDVAPNAGPFRDECMYVWLCYLVACLLAWHDEASGHWKKHKSR